MAQRDTGFGQRQGLQRRVQVGRSEETTERTTYLHRPQVAVAGKPAAEFLYHAPQRRSDLAVASITVTNLGDLGVEAVHGVIHPPQVALVGFGAIQERPWAVDGLLGVRPLVTATLAADHRATDGATGARLLNTLDRLLQQPEDLW